MTTVLTSVRVGRVATRQRPEWDRAAERAWQTAYVKDEVPGPVRVTTLGLEGDEQADRRHHGGPHMALLAYGGAHYPRWREELAFPEFGPGAFGENWVWDGLDETTVCLGDEYAVGESVVVQVASPRGPCLHISRRWDREDLLKRVVATHRTGWYLRVLREGTVARGAAVVRTARTWPELTVAEVSRLRLEPASDPDRVVAIAACAELAPDWREKFAQLAKSSGR